MPRFLLGGRAYCGDSVICRIKICFNFLDSFVLVHLKISLLSHHLCFQQYHLVYLVWGWSASKNMISVLLWTCWVDLKATTRHSIDPFPPSLLCCRLIWQGSNGRGLCGRDPLPHQCYSRWQKRTPSCAASAAAWRRMCYAFGVVVSGKGDGNFGCSGGGMTQTLLISSTMSLQVRSSLPICMCLYFEGSYHCF